jgi:Tfp pilus assembly protein PilN
MWYLIITMGIFIGVLKADLYLKNDTISTLNTTIVNLNSKIVTQTDTINNLTTSRNNCIALIDVQNSGIDTVKQEQAALNAKLKIVYDINLKKDETIKQLLKDIQVASVPKDCDGALKVLSKFSKDFTTDWNKK